MEKNEFKVISYNVAGLPVSLDLNNLPWYLKPISWIYKLIKKTSIIFVNSSGPGEGGTIMEANLLYKGDYDIIGVQENFNYNNILINILGEKYNYGEHAGGLELSKFSKLIDLHWNRLPSFDIDGLNIFVKKQRIKIINETRIKWNSYCGYIGHANDALMNKGFRIYNILLDDIIPLDIYILHMDADFNHESEDINTRKEQFNQLINYINDSDTNNPIIVIGDTNSTYNIEADANNINTFLHSLKNNFTPKDAYIECGKQTTEDIDKIFYINNSKSDYIINPLNCYSDYTFKNDDGSNLSDHNPIIASFNYIKK